MIVIKQVRRDIGQVLLKIEYDFQGGVQAVWIDAKDIVERFKAFRELMGRRPSVEECKQILVKMINDLRAGRQPFEEVIPWENFINVDLEEG